MTQEWHFFSNGDITYSSSSLCLRAGRWLPPRTGLPRVTVRGEAAVLLVWS